MTISNVKNKLGEREREEKKLMKAIDLELPKNFKIEVHGKIAEIFEKSVSWLPLRSRIAYIFLRDGYLQISLGSVEDYDSIKIYLEKSENKFEVTIDDDDYW